MVLTRRQEPGLKALAQPQWLTPWKWALIAFAFTSAVLMPATGPRIPNTLDGPDLSSQAVDVPTLPFPNAMRYARTLAVPDRLAPLGR